MKATSRACSDEGTRYAWNITQAQNGRLLYGGLTLALVYRIAVIRLPPRQWWDIAAMLLATAAAWLLLMHHRDCPVWPRWLASARRSGTTVMDERVLRVRAAVEASLFTALFCSFCLDCSVRLLYFRAPLGDIRDLTLVFFATLLVGAHRNLRYAPPAWTALRRGTPGMLAALAGALIPVSLAGRGSFWPSFISGSLGGAIGIAVYAAVVRRKDREVIGPGEAKPEGRQEHGMSVPSAR